MSGRSLLDLGIPTRPALPVLSYPSCTTLPALAWVVSCELCCLLFLVISPIFEAGEVISFNLNVFCLGSDQTILEAMHNVWAGYTHSQRTNESVEFLCKLAHKYTSTSSRVGVMKHSPGINGCIQVWLRSYI